MNISNKVILEYSKNLTILYVEDDTMLQTSGAKLFENYFKRVDVASDGEEGMQKYHAYKQATQTYYDIVITDISMPKMNGLEMSKAMVLENEKQAIIFVTAYNEISYLMNAIEVGASGFLLKPIDLQQLKQVFYKTSLAMSDNHFVNNYYQNIEAININLMEKNKNLQLCTSIQSLSDDLALNKNIILDRWISNLFVIQKLQSHRIDEEYFKNHFATKVFDYFIGVVHGSNEIGNCPAMGAMLHFFRYKNLPLESIFIICSHFKNALNCYIFEKYDFNSTLYGEVALILDRNFEGVISKYMSLKIVGYENNYATKKIETSEILTQVLDYCDYVFEHDIYEMQDLEVEIDNIFIKITMDTNRNIGDFLHLGVKVQRYGHILTSYPIFEELGSYIVRLGDSFTNNALLLFEDGQKVANISTLIEGFVNDLVVWRKEVFENNIADANFLNDSFFSNVSTIINYIEYDEASQEALDDEGVEFF